MTTTLALQSMPVNTDRTNLDVQLPDNATGVQAHVSADDRADQPTPRKTAKGRKRLSPEQIAARDGHQRAERQLAPRPQTVPAGAGIEPASEPPADAPSAHPPARTGRDIPRITDATTTAPATATVTAKVTGKNTDTAASNISEPATYVFTNDTNIEAETRRAALAAIQPEGPERDVAAVRAAVIELVETIPYVSYQSDRSLLIIGVAFARWCLHNSADGKFVPTRDLTADAFDDFLTFAKSGVTDPTRDTYASQLRRLARNGRPVRKGSPKPGAAPYSPRVRDRLWQEASDMNYWGAAEMCTLLSLTFGAGCLGAEVHTATAGQVERVGNRVVLTIIRERMWVREVPVFGQYGRWLDQRSRELDPDQHLFRPTVTKRPNATSDLVMRMRKRNDVFTGFKSNRARNAWLVACLQAGVPFHAVCQAAGLGRDTNLASDMLPYMPALTPVETRRRFEAVFARSGVTG